MKSVLYLSLIAVVALCSCKGNSYLSQRYTHFSHSAKKANHPAVAYETTTKPVVSEPVLTEFVMPAQNVQQPVASADNLAAKSVQAKPAAVPHHFQLPKIKDIGRAANLPSQKLSDSVVQKQSAAKAHRGLIFGLIDLALFIVIVAVIVVGVILLVAIIL